MADLFTMVVDNVNGSLLDLEAHAILLLFPTFVFAVKSDRGVNCARSILNTFLGSTIETLRADSKRQIHLQL